MIKALGAMIFILGGLFLGRSVERNYANKIDFWQEVMSFITFCKSEIEKYGADLDAICIKERERGGRYSRMIADVVQYNKATTTDQKLLCDFATGLREVGLSTQADLFSTYEKIAEQRLENAKKTHEKKGKTYFRLIPVLFIGVAVLLW